MSEPERIISVGPAAVVAAVLLLLGLRRRSRTLALLGVAAAAVELSPPYREWTTARARAKLAPLDDAG